jgi:hypothetical protein
LAVQDGDLVLDAFFRMMSLMVSNEILAVEEDRENQTISDFSVKSFLTKGFGRGIGILPWQLLEEQGRQGIKKRPGRRVAPTPGRAAGRQGLKAGPLESRPAQAQ